MTRFLDGPAQGETLMLRRSPIFLRVTKDEQGTLDALDQLGDRPRPGEQLFAYRLEGEPTACHVNISGGRGGFFPIAEYRLVPEQPGDSVLRDSSTWQEWTRAVWKARAS